MRKFVCALLTGALLLALCAGTAGASGLPGFEPPPIQIPLTIVIQNPNQDKTTAVVGETLTATWLVFGSSPPYDKVSSFWILDEALAPSFEKVSASPEDYVNSLTFAKPMTARLVVLVQDGGSSLSVSSGTITVSEPEQLSIAITFDRPSVALHQAIHANWEVSGGVPPYKQVMYSWMLYKDGVYSQTPYAATTAVGNSTFVPTEGESLALSVSVIDSAVKAKDVTSAWIPILSPLPITIKLNPLSKPAVTLGDIITGSWSVSGGNLPYTSIRFQWLPLSGGQSLPASFGIAAVEGYSSFWPKAGDQLIFSVEVVDAGLYTQSKSAAAIPILPVRRGDANQDGLVDLLDLVSIINFITLGTFPQSYTNANADANDQVNIQDVVCVINNTLGL